MPEYLIAVAIGPVQNFIAAARKTHDLWFGSYVLSEVSKAVAFALHQQQAELIFPAPRAPEKELIPREDSSGLNVANKLLARINEEEPAKVLEKAKDAARTRWKQLAQDTLRKKRLRFDEHIRQHIWTEQLDDILELYSAWVKLVDAQEGYQAARNRVEQLLAARKTTRDFKPAAVSFNQQPYLGLPKSSLDAARETVLEKTLSSATRRKLGLGANEQLDCPGVIKRLGGNPEQFSPVTRITLETWLQDIPAEDIQELNQLYEQLVQRDWATRVRPQRYHKLPFDGDLLFPDRIDALRREMQDTTSLDILRRFEKARRPLYRKYGEPNPYYAILVADGDKMGEFLDEKGFQEHQNISRALGIFATKARKIVEHETYRGACVYAGGDDVMALLPLDTAVDCAQALPKAFEEAISSVQQEKRPTLSVGLGISHVMTPFSSALEVGRRAEKYAKNGAENTSKQMQRNALAIILNIRSGTETSIRGQWDSGIVARLNQWKAYYHEQQLSSKTPYDLLTAIQDMAWAQDQDDFKLIVKQEISRVLKKKRAHSGSHELSPAVMETIEQEIERHGILPILNELHITRWLAQKNGA